MAYQGTTQSKELRTRRRKDMRRLSERINDYFRSSSGVIMGIALIVLLGAVGLFLSVPLVGELCLILAWWYNRKYVCTERQFFDFPYRVPALAGNCKDGSTPKGKGKASGITYLGNDNETKEEIWSNNSDLRTHMLVLGTTGSGKTEFLLGLVYNALVQNTGCIYVDGKGDPKLQKDIFRLARYLGREDDLLIINFITSGRDFIEKQHDKATNNMNLMANVSSGMLIELIVSLMDSSSGGDDMWKGRAISLVAALTRPLIYLRDRGVLILSPQTYLDYFELGVLEEMVFEHEGKYGDMFDIIVAPLRSYLLTLPGYQQSKRKKQDPKTLEQHGYLTMQLTRIFNDLSFTYGHIFRTKVGDVDFFDVVLNRRILIVLLPALERAPDSLRMLGKMIVGSIKQMMAGCLGNRVEGVVREIIESRPTNAAVPYYTILDEYGYYAVVGFAVAPAQARSLGFSMIFAAQDFSSLKKASPEEADATWENTNVRVVGRLTSGDESETWRRISGAGGEAEEAVVQSFERKAGVFNERIVSQDMVSTVTRKRISYNDLAQQENGEFTFIVGKKGGGSVGGVRVIRGMGFYTAGKAPKEMRINDFLPMESPEATDLPQNQISAKAFNTALLSGDMSRILQESVKEDVVLNEMSSRFERLVEEHKMDRHDATFAMLGWYLAGAPLATPIGHHSESGRSVKTATEKTTGEADTSFDGKRAQALASIAASIRSKETPATTPPRDDSRYKPAESTLTTTARVPETDADASRTPEEPASQTTIQNADAGEKQEGDLACPGALRDMDMMSRGAPYTSMEEKWSAEEEIEKYRRKATDITDYPGDHELKPVTLGEAEALLDELMAKCEQIKASTE